MTLDFNRATIAATPFNVAINAALESGTQSQQPRPYLGASAIGSDCLRKIQYDWQCDSQHEARTRRIFARGHAAEATVAESFRAAGFDIVTHKPDGEQIGFRSLGDRFRGHVDGVIRGGPPVLKYPCLWECKCLGSKGWKKLEKYGLKISYSHYEAQVQLYMAYLDLHENPALFTAMNADTCELLHILVPFDAEAAQSMSDRAVRIVEATEAHELLPRVADSADDWRCKSLCSHRERCWG